MMDAGPPLVDLAFTCAVGMAVLMVLTDTYPDVIMAGAMVLVIWQLVTTFGASLALATVILLVAGLLRASATLIGLVVRTEQIGSQPLASLLDGLLAGRDQSEHDQRDQLLRRHLADRPEQRRREKP